MLTAPCRLVVPRRGAVCFRLPMVELPLCLRHVRLFRTRSGALPTRALESADANEAFTATRRPPPNALALSYVVEKIPSELLEGRCCGDNVWQAPTLKEAWKQLHGAYAEFCEIDPVRVAQLRQVDLPALAMCTGRAETLHLLSLLPADLRLAITSHPCFRIDEVEEFFLHVGQDVEVRGAGWVVQLPPPTTADLQFVLRTVGKFGEDGRGCIANTAHRVSVWRGRHGESLGVTVRVGRFVPNAARALLPLVHKGSLLILSKAGMGKTTLLRDLAAALAQEPDKPRVTIVDTSNEIGGDGPIPMSFLGRCRRIQVPTRGQQSKVMTEVIQNHSPEYLVVDELATAEEAQAAWSIAQRGVRLIATCHGESLAGLLQNQSLNLLVGGAAQAFLSNEERRLRNKTKKTVLERPHSSPFQFVAELNARRRAHVYVDVNQAVDLVLDDQSAKGNASVGGPVELDQPLPLRLEKLIASQGGAARSNGSLPRHREKDDEDVLAGNPIMDEDGYTVPPNPSRGNSSSARLSYSSGGAAKGKRLRARKSDDELLDDLNRFL